MFFQLSKLKININQSQTIINNQEYYLVIEGMYSLKNGLLLLLFFAAFLQSQKKFFLTRSILSHQSIYFFCFFDSTCLNTINTSHTLHIPSLITHLRVNIDSPLTNTEHDQQQKPFPPSLDMYIFVIRYAYDTSDK